MLFFFTGLNAQKPNIKYHEHWTDAGSTPIKFKTGTKLNIVSYGADSTGKLFSDTIVNNLIKNAVAGDTIFFPKGKYQFQKSIILKDSLVIVGEGEESILKMNLNTASDAIQCRGSILKAKYSIQSTIISGDHSFISPGSSFLPGTYLQFFQNDSDLITSGWAKNTVSEIVMIQKIIGDTFYIFPSFKLDYPLIRKPWFVVMNPAKDIQIKCVKIIRIDSTLAQNSNINLNYCTRILISGITSQNCNYSHISLDNSSNCTITGSYFSQSFGYGGGGKGYGIALQTGSCQNLITNSIFKHLRHSVLMQSGSNGNVISYNYSTDPFWTETSVPSNSAGDLVLHGNYPFANLFEGNICQNIVVDDSHGKNGPDNVFFRNRAELFGIFMNTNPASNQQAFLNNEIPNTEFLKGLYYINGTGHWESGNKIKGAYLPTGTLPLTDSSFYLKSRPSFWLSSIKWPFCGSLTSSGTETNPAQMRFKRNQNTTCVDLNFLKIDQQVKNYNSGIEILNNPVNKILTIKITSNPIQFIDIQLFKSTGEKVLSHTFNRNTDEDKVLVNVQNINSGIYFLRINGETQKLMIEN